MVKFKLFLCLILFVFLNKAFSQDIYLYHYNTSQHCKNYDAYYLYCSINNKILVKYSDNSKINLEEILLKSDSLTIEKVNDSIYYLSPLYKNVHVKVYITDVLSGKKTDSVRSYCIGQPFSFTINPQKSNYSFGKKVIDKIDRVYLEHMRQGCLDYASGFKIISYDLVLKRNDIVILSGGFKGEQLIGNTFKKKLKQLSKSGDGLFIRNMTLKGKDGQQIKVDEYGLLKI